MENTDFFCVVVVVVEAGLAAGFAGSVLSVGEGFIPDRAVAALGCVAGAAGFAAAGFASALGAVAAGLISAGFTVGLAVGEAFTAPTASGFVVAALGGVVGVAGLGAAGFTSALGAVAAGFTVSGFAAAGLISLFAGVALGDDAGGVSAGFSGMIPAEVRGIAAFLGAVGAAGAVTLPTALRGALGLYSPFIIC